MSKPVAIEQPVSRERSTMPMGGTKNVRLKVARVESELSQAELASAAGVTRQTIGLIEAGGYNPTLNLCITICKILGKTLDDLFWEEEE